MASMPFTSKALPTVLPLLPMVEQVPVVCGLSVYMTANCTGNLPEPLVPCYLLPISSFKSPLLDVDLQVLDTQNQGCIE